MPWPARFTFTALTVTALACAKPSPKPPPPPPLAASSPSAPRLPGRALQRDIDVLREAYEALHPGLYRYNEKAQMAASFEALRAELGQDRTLTEAYLAFSIFLAKVKCGHSYANFYNQPKTLAATLFQHQDRVPYYFRWIGRRMIVTKDFSGDPHLVPGAEVLSINGVPATTILERLMTIARADGSNDDKRVNELEVQGSSEYEAFDVFFPMFFPPSSATLTLEVRSPLTRETATTRVTALTYAQRFAPIKAAFEGRHGGDTPVWDLSFPGERTAVLRMPTFALFDSAWDWKGFLDKASAELQRREIASLILDLRGNEGGLDVGDVLLSWLITEDLRLDQYKRLVRYQKVPASLLPYLDTWDPSFKDWGDKARDPSGGFYTLTKYDDAEGANVIKASPHPFKGRAYAIIDASNSSSTFQFALVLKQHKLATLVGSSTGGNQRGINGGAFFFLRLPESKIEIDLPLIGTYPSGARPDAGIAPDVRVEPRLADIARGIDTELEAAKALAAGGRRD